MKTEENTLGEAETLEVPAKAEKADKPEKAGKATKIALKEEAPVATPDPAPQAKRVAEVPVEVPKEKPAKRKVKLVGEVDERCRYGAVVFDLKKGKLLEAIEEHANWLVSTGRCVRTVG